MIPPQIQSQRAGHHSDVADVRQYRFRGGVLANACFQDGPTAAEMLGLSGRVAGIAEVDQVEIDSVDSCAVQVCPAQVGLANLFGGFEILLAVIVGVEARAAAFAGDWAPDEAAADEPRWNVQSLRFASRRSARSQSMSASPVRCKLVP